MASESILEAIHEQTTNLEKASSLATIRQHLKEAIREQGRTERSTRSKTASFSLRKAHSAEALQDKVMAYALMAQLGPVAFRSSKELLFVQFATPGEKEAAIDFIKLSHTSNILKETLLPANPITKGHFERLPVKLELNNLHSSIKLDKVKEVLDSLIDDSKGGKLISIKDGKPSAINGKRTISMKVNSHAFSDIFEKMNGMVPFNDGKTKTTLFFRINCRPWQCRACYAIGHHPTCDGKTCTKCGAKEHQATNCTKRTRFCTKCKKPGHSARDSHCPRYLNEFAKEVRKFDFPLEYLEDNERIGQLIKQLQLK